jgi:Chlorophyllase enzyme
MRLNAAGLIGAAGWALAACGTSDKTQANGEESVPLASVAVVAPTATPSMQAPALPSSATTDSPASSASAPAVPSSPTVALPPASSTGPTTSASSVPDPSIPGGCSPGEWPAADPATPGPFSVVTENDVGPTAGEDDEGNPTAFTLFRPEELGEAGRCHPVITWGNGTSANPSLYKVLLGHLASHGFVVIASDNPNVAQGNPAPMSVGVTWVLEQNADPASALYQRIDVSHIGATGHSQGGLATTTAGGDPNVTTIAPLCGAGGQRNLRGPALLFCGGLDEIVPCDSIQRTFDGIDAQPVMLANYLTADHGNWITFRGTTLSPTEIAVTAWMRVHLMADSALRSWFYGPDCKLCTDAAWETQQKMMTE